jgi:hypothetical protein
LFFICQMMKPLIYWLKNNDLPLHSNHFTSSSSLSSIKQERDDTNDRKEVEELNLTNCWCSGWDELLHLVESSTQIEKKNDHKYNLAKKTTLWLKKNNKWAYSHAIRSSLFDHYYDQAQTYERTPVVLTQERKE